MGNKLCCNEDRDPSLASKEEENNDLKAEIDIKKKKIIK